MNLGLHGLDFRQGAVLHVSWAMLAAVLRLPPGMRITAMRPRDESWNEATITLRIEGDGCPWVEAGVMLPEVVAVYRRAACGELGHAEFVELQDGGPYRLRNVEAEAFEAEMVRARRRGPDDYQVGDEISRGGKTGIVVGRLDATRT